MVVAKALNVRQTEGLVRRSQAGPAAAKAPPKRPPATTDANTAAIERSLEDLLGLTVKIDHTSPGGTMTIRYGNLIELNDLLKRLGRD